MTAPTPETQADAQDESGIVVPDYIRHNYQPDPLGLAIALRREAFRRKGAGDHTAGNLLMVAAVVIVDLVQKGRHAP